MAIREGRWDCPSCGSTAIYGRHVDCTGCGKPRPAGVRFYLTDDAPVVTDPERLKEATAGADWICLHCEASNRATVDRCGGCGAARGSSPTQPVVTYADGQVPAVGAPDAPLGAAAIIRRPPEPEPKPERRKRNVAGWVVGGAMGIFVLGGMVDEIKPRARVRTPDPLPAVVEDVRWERAVFLEARTLVPGEGWELPDSATEVTQSPRVSHTRQEVSEYRTVTRTVPRRTRERVGERTVWVGGTSGSTSCETRDLGNGYFDEVCEETEGSPGYETTEPVYREVTVYDTVTEQEPVYRSVPVYAPYYSYRVPLWQAVDTVRAAGGRDTPPAWPQVEVPAGQRPSRWDRYEVVIRHADGSQEVVQVYENEWGGFRPGQRVAYARAGGNRYVTRILPRDSLPACRNWHSGNGKEPPPDSLGCSPRPPKQAQK